MTQKFHPWMSACPQYFPQVKDVESKTVGRLAWGAYAKSGLVEMNSPLYVALLHPQRGIFGIRKMPRSWDAKRTKVCDLSKSSS